MTLMVAVAGCLLAAAAALLPLRRPVFTGAVAAGSLLWTAAAVAGGVDAARPLSAACVLLLLLLARRLLEDRRQAQRLLTAERALRAADAEAATVAERERIARDLHDGLTHLLTSELLVLRTAQAALVDGDLASAAERLDHGVRLAGRALTEARDVVGVLGGRAPDLTLLRETVAQWEQATHAEVALRLPAALPALSGAAWAAALATLREALTNAARHAPGAPVDVALTEADGRLHLTVRTDSPGPPSTGELAAGALPAGGGTGLQGLRERAALAGGTLAAGPVADRWQVVLDVPAGPA